MRKQWFPKSVALLAFIGAQSLVLSAQSVRTALPGTVNYVEGQVSIDGRDLSTKQDGNTQVQPNQTLSTKNGKVEMLLSPGVLVRAGNNSEIRLVSSGLVNPAIEVLRGEAMVEVDQKPKEAQVEVLEHGGTASILKEGLYSFRADEGRIEVIDGKLRVAENGNFKEFGKGKEVVLNGEPLKPVSFDRKAEDDLYRWSNVRSDYLAEANAATARNIYMGYGSFSGTGWYWNPYFASWSWLPGNGFFYSPFGYPFFSPGYAVYAPYGRFGFRPGYVARGFAPRAGVRLAPHVGAGGHFGGGHR
jgi:FecR-like protein